MPRSSKAISSQHPLQAAPLQAAPLPLRQSFFQTIQEGLAFGLGSSVARNMVDKVLRPSDTCAVQYSEFTKCISEHEDTNVCMEEHATFKKCIQSTSP